jgi:hypothetical protein
MYFGVPLVNTKPSTMLNGRKTNASIMIAKSRRLKVRYLSGHDINTSIAKTVLVGWNEEYGVT